MSFVDQVLVKVAAGDGGDGHVSFRREKFVDKGGPDGGDGGNGGNVIIRASNNQDTLASFRYHKEIVAKSGQPGSKNKKHGKSAEDTYIDVPVGTSVYLDTVLIVDLYENKQEFTIAKGGKGGFGNAHFVSSKRQTPRFAEKGLPGEKLTYRFELKLIADVGLVGLPNAGKSTLLSVISNAKPEIANYPFTTITPNLGVVDYLGKTILFADIPGLIEGAAEGKGLGHDFLKHVERTRLIIHLIDINGEDVVSDYKLINNELKSYSKKLSLKKQIVVLTKADSLSPLDVESKLQKIKKSLPSKTAVLIISSFSKQGIDDLLMNVNKELQKNIIKIPKILPVIRLSADNAKSWQVKKSGKNYTILGLEIERFASKTDFNNDDAVLRFKNILKRKGIYKELVKQGIKPGNRIIIGNSGKNLEY